MAPSVPDSEQSRPSDPPPALWADLGLTPEAEIHAGHQSRVFKATGPAGRVIVKMIEAGPDRAVARQRVVVNQRLAAINPAVVGPLESTTRAIVETDELLVVSYPEVDGSPPDVDDQGHVEAMAVTLAALHRSLATLTDTELPPVAALVGSAAGPLSDDRLIHGDYAAANLIVTPAGLRVIDLADCGRGSAAFEIGNSLYMARFDAWQSDQLDRYDRFRTWFVDAYRAAAASSLDDALLDQAIRVRAEALGRWLADPATAPVGIRTVSPAWRRRLEAFLDDVLA